MVRGAGLLACAALLATCGQPPATRAPAPPPSEEAARATGTVGGPSTPTTAAPTPSPLPRALEDRPDDDPTGYQVHFLYAIPSDLPDDGLDVNGTLERSIASIQRWLSRQTGGRTLGVDTFGGRPDITFARLSRPDAEIRSYDNLVRDTVEAELRARGFDHPRKLYAVYYDGGSDAICGGAPWPPELPGNYGVVYLRAHPRGFPIPCLRLFAISVDQPLYVDFSILHETVHVLGLVGTCAPNHALQGHVSDSNTDLMYAGTLPWGPAALDVGRNDYFEHGRPGCLDLATSAFLRPVPPAPTLPPRWPHTAAPTRSCSEEGALRTTSERIVGEIQFTNLTPNTVRIYRLDHAGQRVLSQTMRPYGSTMDIAEGAHAWAATDDRDGCLALFTAVEGWARATVRAR